MTPHFGGTTFRVRQDYLHATRLNNFLVFTKSVKTTQPLVRVRRNSQYNKASRSTGIHMVQKRALIGPPNLHLAQRHLMIGAANLTLKLILRLVSGTIAILL